MNVADAVICRLKKDGSNFEILVDCDKAMAFKHGKKINVDDISESILKFSNQSIAKIHLDFLQRPFYKSCKITGSKGIVYWNSDENKIKLYNSKKRKWNNHTILNNYKLSSNKINQMYVDELLYFLNCVKKRNLPMNNISEAKTILDVALSMKKSSFLKKTIRI